MTVLSFGTSLNFFLTRELLVREELLEYMICQFSWRLDLSSTGLRYDLSAFTQDFRCR